MPTPYIFKIPQFRLHLVPIKPIILCQSIRTKRAQISFRPNPIKLSKIWPDPLNSQVGQSIFENKLKTIIFSSSKQPIFFFFKRELGGGMFFVYLSNSSSSRLSQIKNESFLIMEPDNKPK